MGHTKLNPTLYIIDKYSPELCETWQVKETVEHVSYF